MGISVINNNRRVFVLCQVLALMWCAGLTRSVAGDTLSHWLERAVEHNPEVVEARARWEAAQTRTGAARSLDDPMVGVYFMRMNATGLDDYDETEFMVSQRIPWFGKRRARTDAASLQADAEGFRYLDSMRQARARTIQAYWDLWLAQRALEINEENRQLLSSYEQIASARYESGVGLQADLLKAQVALAEIENEYETLQATFSVAQAAVNRLLHQPADTAHAVSADPDPPVLGWTLDEAYQAARTYSARLASSLLEKEARKAEVREARLLYAPDIELRVAARQQRGRSINEYDTGIAINVPWLWRGKYREGVNEARREQDRAEATYQAERDRLYFEVKEAYVKASSAWRALQLYADTILPRTRQLLEAVRAAYQNGETDFLNLIDAQRQWTAATLAEAQTRAAYARYMADLSARLEPWREYEYETGLVTEDKR